MKDKEKLVLIGYNELLNQFLVSEFSNKTCIDDIGNLIGIAVGKYIENEDDKEQFIQGIEHGISLIDGTH